MVDAKHKLMTHMVCTLQCSKVRFFFCFPMQCIVLTFIPVMGKYSVSHDPSKIIPLSF